MSTKRIFDAIKDNAPLIVSIAAAVGVGVTAVLSAKAGAKAERIKHRKLKPEEDEADKKAETVICYIPAAVSGAITCFCIIEAHILNGKQKAALLACYMTMTEAYREYRKKNIELYGEENDNHIMEEIQKANPPSIYDPASIGESDDLPSEEVILMWTEYTGYFRVPTTAVVNAALNLNRNLTLEGFIPIRQYFQFMGVELKDDGSEKFPDKYGFSMDTLMEEWNSTWFDIWYHKNVTDDGLEYWTIDFAMEPEYVEYCFDYWNYG